MGVLGLIARRFNRQGAMDAASPAPAPEVAAPAGPVPEYPVPAYPVPAYQGYVDERSVAHVAGWLRDLNDAAARLGYEVVLPEDDAERVLAAGIADAASDVLVQVGVGDGRYAFRAVFAAPVSEAERDRIFVRPVRSAHRLELAPALQTAPPGTPRRPFQGFVDARSVVHVAGWVWDLSDPASRLELEVVLPGPDGERVLARAQANRFNQTVLEIGSDDGLHGFYLNIPPLTTAERDRVQVRVAGTAHDVALSPALNTAFEPIVHVAMDIVNNCNLRCPFCVYDYANTTRTEFMSDATFEAALRLIPYVGDSNFWLSCLHEATLHPKLLTFIERVPQEYRHKLFFTTNLAKRMPQDYFDRLAGSGMRFINISIESLDPAVYERMRRGARLKIFRENWGKLLAAFTAGSAAPRLRYNVMAYRSNLREIPGLVALLRREKAAWQVEIRSTFDMPHIDPAFREKEFLTTAEWAWLDAALQPRDENVMLLLPPGGVGYEPAPAAAAAPGADLGEPVDTVLAEVPERVPQPFNVRISWDGRMDVFGEEPSLPGRPAKHTYYLKTNINELADPVATLLKP